MLEVSCRCGNRIRVTAGQAGSAIACQCGESVAVPSLRELRQTAEAAGRDTRPPARRHDWRAWWWGMVVVVIGETAQMAAVLIASRGVAVDSHYLVYILFTAGLVLSFAGVFVVGLGKGFALWLCVVLCFCVPFGRVFMVFFPGKGADPEP